MPLKTFCFLLLIWEGTSFAGLCKGYFYRDDLPREPFIYCAFGLPEDRCIKLVSNFYERKKAEDPRYYDYKPKWSEYTYASRCRPFPKK